MEELDHVVSLYMCVFITTCQRGVNCGPHETERDPNGAKHITDTVGPVSASALMCLCLFAALVGIRVCGKMSFRKCELFDS